MNCVDSIKVRSSSHAVVSLVRDLHCSLLLQNDFLNIQYSAMARYKILNDRLGYRLSDVTGITEMYLFIQIFNGNRNKWRETNEAITEHITDVTEVNKIVNI